MVNLRCAAGLLAFVFLLPGCGSQTATVSGTVTYNGTKVSTGWITFNPDGEAGPGGGAAITDGAYQVEKLKPGKKIVQIVGVKQVMASRTGVDLTPEQREKARQGDTSFMPRADEVPPDAVGNNAQVSIEPDTKTMNFELKSPAQPKETAH